MNKKVFPQLGEQYFEQRLENGMMVRVVEKPGFAKKYAFVAVNFGSIDTKFRLNGVDYATPDGVAHYLEQRCSTCRRATRWSCSRRMLAATTPLRAMR